jgi:hypothetical protein
LSPEEQRFGAMKELTGTSPSGVRIDRLLEGMSPDPESIEQTTHPDFMKALREQMLANLSGGQSAGQVALGSAVAGQPADLINRAAQISMGIRMNPVEENAGQLGWARYKLDEWRLFQEMKLMQEQLSKGEPINPSSLMDTYSSLLNKLNTDKVSMSRGERLYYIQALNAAAAMVNDLFGPVLPVLDPDDFERQMSVGILDQIFSGLQRGLGGSSVLGNLFRERASEQRDPEAAIRRESIRR